MTKSQSHNTPLTLDLVESPAMHRLILTVSDTSVHIFIASRVSDNTYISRTVDFVPGLNPFKALEETVYENPLLTADFAKIDIIVDNNRFFLMAADDVNDAEIRRRIDALWPPESTDESLVPLVCPVEKDRTALVTALPHRLAGFLQRTFNNPVISHRIAVSASYYAGKNHLGNMGKIHVFVSEKRTDIHVFSREGLMLANSFATSTANDTAFYTLAAARHFGFDNETDRILVAGAPGLRDNAVALLRKFKPFVMPEILPATVSAALVEPDAVPLEALLIPLL